MKAKKASVWKRRDGCGMGCNTLALCDGYHFNLSFYRLRFIVALSLFRLCLTLTCMRSAGAIKPATILSSRERVARKNEACNMLWSPGWRIQIVGGLLIIRLLIGFQLIVSILFCLAIRYDIYLRKSVHYFLVMLFLQECRLSSCRVQYQ